MARSPGTQADDWIAMATSAPSSHDLDPDGIFERGSRLNDHVIENPDFGLEIIKVIVRRYAEPDLFQAEESQAQQVLANLGAGPLEDLLVHHGPSHIDAVVIEASRDRRFGWTLCCVWLNSIADDVWARVQAVTGGFSP